MTKIIVVLPEEVEVTCQIIKAWGVTCVVPDYTGFTLPKRETVRLTNLQRGMASHIAESKLDEPDNS